MTRDYWTWTAAELAPAIASGSVSAEEVTDSVLARIGAVNGRINAVVDTLDEDARQAARTADATRRAGGPTGPLHGVPVTIKINVDYAGRATTNGVVAFADLIAPDDAAVVANLRKAGAVIVGRTNAPAFSVRRFSDNALYGPTLNPYDKGITVGGSSGGAAAAVAAGMAPLAHGNDIGGSIRYPAYCCGVFGLRPTLGLVPAYNPSQAAERPIASQLAAVQGPLARTVADLRLFMQAACAADPRDIWQVPLPPMDRVSTHRPCRVAVLDEGEGFEADPAVQAAIGRAAAMLSDAGYDVVRVPVPSMKAGADLWRLIIGNEMRSGLVPLAEKFGDATIRKQLANVLNGLPELDRAEFLKAYAGRGDQLRAWQLFLAETPLVLSANTWGMPMAVDLDQDPDLDLDAFYGDVAPNLVQPILGLPALAVPMGEAEGVPVGVQLTATRFAENLLLAAGEALERAQTPVRPLDPRW
ncbi:amidase [Maritimibacter alkaliphilus]|uniref:amidase n=1 Tax=Maritimibacter alkaliphilus TaxID=404236 RepID=UPI001C97F597|nr:amidase [Maritimibacter alkaliphilus]MBY6093106.1 amidase [Maritimibacter alkaliphilus]